MPEHELWLTALFNDHLAGLANSILSAVHVTADNPARPWADWLVMELAVAAILVILVTMLRPRLSAEKPGTTQHVFEVVYEFLTTTAQDVGLHHPAEFVPFFGTLFVFILAMNMIGLVPAFTSPTASPVVPAGLAVCTFVYYNYIGLRQNGLLKYLGHFAGPVWYLAPLMFPLELISHFARPLTLTVRLYGNIFAGDQVIDIFIRLTRLVGPVIFMGLHLFEALIQAYVFTMLAIIYIGGAVAHEEDPI
jgi:F-type H+-transporting ATPase subunit a